MARLSAAISSRDFACFEGACSRFPTHAGETLRKVMDEREDDQERPRAAAGRSGPRARRGRSCETRSARDTGHDARGAGQAPRSGAPRPRGASRDGGRRAHARHRGERRQRARRARPSCVAELARVARRGAARRRRGARRPTSGCSTLRPGDTHAAEAIERADAKRAKWRDLVERYLQEAQGATRPGVPQLAARQRRGGDLPLRYEDGDGDPSVERIVALLREALILDPKNRRAEMLLERLLREQRALGGSGAGHRALRAARRRRRTRRSRRGCASRASATKKPQDAGRRAVEAYEHVLDLVPRRTRRRRRFLADHFTSREMWEHLVALYEGQLSTGALRGKEEEFGAVLQIAMVHWRMRSRADAAEPWFERVRKLEPAHPGMLSFFREWCSARGESARLATVLTEAQRAMPDGPERTADRRRDREARRGGRQRAEGDRAVARAPAAGPQEQGRARRAPAALSSDGELERADRSAAAGAREAAAGRPRGPAIACCATSPASTAIT